MVVDNLTVCLNNKRVGKLSLDDKGNLHFSYASSWLSDENSRPISLSLPLTQDTYTGEKVYNFFQNLLPDSDSILGRLRKRLFIVSSHPFAILKEIGADCVGALSLQREKISDDDFFKIKNKFLKEKELGEILRNYQARPLGMTNDLDFRISLAGAQEKTAFLRFQNKWAIPLKTTPSTHIFKLPIGKIEYSGIDLSDSCENEWLCLRLLDFFDVPVVSAALDCFDGQKVLIAERFDRAWAKNNRLIRLPTEDLCQVFALSPDKKYETEGKIGIESIMNFLKASVKAYDDRMNFFKVQVLFWMLGAIDGHAKNFSIFIHKGGTFSLAPFYDVMSVWPLVAKGNLSLKKVKMAMAVIGKNRHYKLSEIKARHFWETGKLCRIPKKEIIKIFNEIVGKSEKLADFAKDNLNNDFPKDISEPILQNIMQKAKELKSFVEGSIK